MTIRVFIANHQPLIRCGLHAVIANDPDLRVVGETGAGAEAVRMTWQLRPDVVLMDLGLSTVDGISAFRMIRSEARDTRVVVMTGVGESVSAMQPIRAGAAGCFPQDSPVEDVLRTIRGARAEQMVAAIADGRPDDAPGGRSGTSVASRDAGLVPRGARSVEQANRLRAWHIEIYFSIIQRKVLKPNDYTSLEELAEAIHAFGRRYSALGKLFAWCFTRQDLERRLREPLLQPEPLTLATAA